MATSLAVANRKLHVEDDPLIAQVDELLPQTNCGACGSPGCAAFAEACVKGNANPGQCTVNSPEMSEYIASSREGEGQQAAQFSICVRRCFYIDDVSGERYPGVASNYLCGLKAGDTIQITGPYGRQFHPPRDESSNIIMIGVGTGIAPFRAFMKHIYESGRNWKGKVRLFYGARTGMELLYMNDRNKDIANY